MFVRVPLILCALCAIWITTISVSAANDTVRIVALGDSLTAGYGLGDGEGLVPQLQDALTAAGRTVEVIDAGVSGDTTSGGLSRLEWSVGPDTDAVIIELGANDALRGIDPAKSRANLDAMVKQLGERGLPVMLIGMRAPTNLGAEYGAAFNAIYGDLAEKHGALLYPYFYEGIAQDPSYALADGIHPTAEGIAVVVENMLPTVLQLADRAADD